MTQNKIVNHDIFGSYKQAQSNTLNFENCSTFTEYDHEDKGIGSAYGLCYDENYIVNNIIPYLKKTAEFKSFSDAEKEEYKCKPMKLSYDIYGTIDYWWILLCVNGYMYPSDFHSFDVLIVPSISDIETIIDKEVFTNETLGKIPESTER